MKLPKTLLAAASTEKQRPMLTGAHIDPANRHLVVCNGRVLVVHPLPEGEIRPGFITPATWKAATKGAKGEIEFDPAAGTVNGHQVDAAEALGQYPNYTQVVPKFDPAYRISFDADLLKVISDALGTKMVTLEFSPENSPEPIIIRTDWRKPDGSPFAVLMPMKPTEGDNSSYGLLTGNAGGSERSDSSPMIERLKARITEEQAKVADFSARVADLTARIEARLAAPAVKPLDTAAPFPTRKRDREKPQVPSATAPPVLSRNQDKNGIELRFNGKPDDATRQGLKDHGFRWLPRQPGQPWAARYSEEALVFASALAESRVPDATPMPSPPPSPSPVNARPQAAAPQPSPPARTPLPDLLDW